MKFSTHGKQELMKSEGALPKVYDDAASTSEKRAGLVAYENSIGYPTIGVGHLIYHPGAGVDQRARFSRYLRHGGAMTNKQMMDLLDEDIPKYEKPIKEGEKVAITQEMYDALVHMAFNIGVNSRHLKDAIAYTNRKDWQSASEVIRNGPQTSKGKRLEGLVRRRNMEADWYLSGGEPSEWMKWGGPLITLFVIGGSIGGALYIRQIMDRG